MVAAHRYAAWWWLAGSQPLRGGREASNTVLDDPGRFCSPENSEGIPLFSGLALFDHMVNLSRRSVSTGQDLMPSAQLDVEYTKVQQRLINPRPMDYAMHEIAKHAHGEDARTSMARRKLDNLGYIRGESGVANDEERRRRLKNQLNLTASVAAISKEESDLKAATASLASTSLIEALRRHPLRCRSLWRRVVI